MRLISPLSCLQHLPGPSEHGKIRITPSAVFCCDKHYLQKQGGELISVYGLQPISGSLDRNLRPEVEAESTEERCCSGSAHLASLYSPGPPTAGWTLPSSHGSRQSLPDVTTADVKEAILQPRFPLPRQLQLVSSRC